MSIKNKIKNLSFDEIKKLLETEGSVFVSNHGKNKIFVEYVYLGDESINELELNPREKFCKIKPNVWYAKQILPKGANNCYWLHKNCGAFKNDLDEHRDNSLVQDNYSKNKLFVVNEKGEKGFAYNFILPVEIPENVHKLKSEKFVIKSNALDDDREVIVTFPKNYSKTKNYKCLVLSDGGMWKWSLNVEQTLAAEAEKGEIDEYIICYLIQKNRNVELVFNKKFCEFLCLELPKFLSKKRIVKSGSENFVFCGQSYGGITALCNEMYFAGAYSTIISQSASLWADKSDEILTYFKTHKIVSSLYYSYGNCEGWFITDKGKKFKGIIKQNPHCKFSIFNGGHNYVSWRANLIDTLKLLKIK